MSAENIVIDGGGGGGQVVRTAVSLSALTGRPVTVENARGGRETPGLKPQHVAAIRAVSALCSADTDGVTTGAESFTFDPGVLRGGDLSISVGSAGSITLVFDTVVPLAIGLAEPVSLTVEGGTDVKWAPPMATYREVTLRMLRATGWRAGVTCHRRGFYPAGGGRATLFMARSEPSALDLRERGAFTGARVDAVASDSLADADVAGRLADKAATELESASFDPVRRRVTHESTDSVGAAVTVRLSFEQGIVGGDALGEKGVPAETIAERAVSAALAVTSGPAAVDGHLGDQLVVPLVLVGGAVSIPCVTDHVHSTLAVLDTFGIECSVDTSGSTPVISAPGWDSNGAD